MSWLKVSDKAGTHPRLMALASVKGAGDDTIDTVTGFVMRLATMSASHLTDYQVDRATAYMIGGPNTDKKLAQAVEAGLLRKRGRGAATTYTIIQLEELFHIRLAADVNFEKQRNRDRRNPDLTMPVRARDGDVCRYCGRVVRWGDNNSVNGRGGTFDHVVEGEAATVDTYVVCCRRCNAALAGRSEADKRERLRPAPDRPHFSAESRTAAELEDYFGHPIHGTTHHAGPARPATTPTESTVSGRETQHRLESTATPWEAQIRARGTGSTEVGEEAQGDAGRPTESEEAQTTTGRKAARRRQRKKEKADAALTEQAPPLRAGPG